MLKNDVSHWRNDKITQEPFGSFLVVQRRFRGVTVIASNNNHGPKKRRLAILGIKRWLMKNEGVNVKVLFVGSINSGSMFFNERMNFDADS